MQEADEPNDTDREVEAARRELEQAHAAMMGAIRKALGEGQGPSRIARHSGYTREYISKIRDGRAGGAYGRKQKHDDGAAESSSGTRSIRR